LRTYMPRKRLSRLATSDSSMVAAVAPFPGRAMGEELAVCGQGGDEGCEYTSCYRMVYPSTPRQDGVVCHTQAASCPDEKQARRCRSRSDSRVISTSARDRPRLFCDFPRQQHCRLIHPRAKERMSIRRNNSSVACERRSNRCGVDNNQRRHRTRARGKDSSVAARSLPSLIPPGRIDRERRPRGKLI
jgi:hypothetical protein